jgi:Fe-S cluster assembly ATPase SufC
MNTQEILDKRKIELTRKRNENALLHRQMDAIEARMLELADQLNIRQEGLAFLEDLANARRGGMKGRIESIITEALRLIYDDSYQSQLNYSVKNNRSHLAIEMIRETKQGTVTRDMGGFGGGLADTMSVPLRLMVLLGAKQTDKVCILDECWKHIDPDRVELVAKFLRVLVDRLGIQVVFLTHHPTMRDFADRVYEVREFEGTSAIEVF